MSAATSYQMSGAARASIDSEILCHDANRSRALWRKLVRAADRLPKPSQVTARQRIGSDVNEVVVIDIPVHEPSSKRTHGLQPLARRSALTLRVTEKSKIFCSGGIFFKSMRLLTCSTAFS